MRHWTLRTRLTLWSAVFFAAAVALLGAFTIALVRKHQVQTLDAELIGETRPFFHELAEHGPAGVMHAMAEIDKASRAVVLAPDGTLLWESPELGGERFSDAPAGALTVGPWRVVSVSRQGYTVRVARDFGNVEATVADVRQAYFLALPVLLLVVAGGAWLLVRSALRPVQTISETARRITSEHLSERLPQPARRDELGQLTSVLNEMLDRLDRGYTQAVRFTADASHELKTPLALIASGIEQLLRRRDLPPGMASELASLLDDNRRLTTVCEDLLLLARADAGHLVIDRRPHDLRRLIEAAVEDARILGAESTLQFEVDLPAHAEAFVDARHVTRILLNLLSNAVKYNWPGGTVRVRLAAEGSTWAVDIANTGAGLAPEQHAKVFERFFRSDKSAATPGHGLGLSLSRELARAHGGDIVLAASDREWTTFRLTLPRSSVASAPALSPATRIEGEPRSRPVTS